MAGSATITEVAPLYIPNLHKSASSPSIFSTWPPFQLDVLGTPARLGAHCIAVALDTAVAAVKNVIPVR